jgi:hypothetical protein
MLVFKVVQFDHPPLISEEACRILGLVKYCNPTSSTQAKTTDKKKEATEKKAKQNERFFETVGKRTAMTSSSCKPKESLQKVKKKIVKSKADNLKSNPKAKFGLNQNDVIVFRKAHNKLSTKDRRKDWSKERFELKPQIPQQAIQQTATGSTHKPVNAEKLDQMDNGIHSIRTPAIDNLTRSGLHEPPIKLTSQFTFETTSSQQSPNINMSSKPKRSSRASIN